MLKNSPFQLLSKICILYNNLNIDTVPSGKTMAVCDVHVAYASRFAKK